ncbi:fumarylacetoacetate hydrolase family protein [Streptomyces sp. NPDC048290]|uniref:fumarylacetoacetate hydrolase family protein n=1 Tax=Streptomyces sp. NPDC048290 TaxID=3155811 RepID=UPI003432D95F
MRIANLSGRLALITSEGKAVDVEQLSEGRFAADPQAVYGQWAEFQNWATDTELPVGIAFDPTDLGAPAPRPRQLFAIGLNYRDHAEEAGFSLPESLPPVFTKFVTSISGPVSEVRLPEHGLVDWEVELVAVIGAHAHDITVDAAWSHVAGLCVGQDLSERILQLAGPAPQFSMGKSYPGFAPMGPWLVTPDEFDDPDDLELRCSLNGEQVQKGRTGNLVYSVPALIAGISEVLPLLPGDVLFTGTPAGVGVSRTPQRRIAPGDLLVSSIEGIGTLSQRFTG